MPLYIFDPKKTSDSTHNLRPIEVRVWIIVVELDVLLDILVAVHVVRLINFTLLLVHRSLDLFELCLDSLSFHLCKLRLNRLDLLLGLFFAKFFL